MMPMIATLIAPFALLPVQALAQDAAVSAPIFEFIAALNKEDIATARATHLSDAVIVDEFPPYIWRGKDSLDAWIAAITRDAKARGISGYAVELGKPTRVLVNGDDAYVIVPSAYRYNQKGVAKHADTQMTFAMRSTAAGWKIASWTWTGPEAVPVPVK